MTPKHLTSYVNAPLCIFILILRLYKMASDTNRTKQDTIQRILGLKTIKINEVLQSDQVKITKNLDPLICKK